MIGCLLLSPRMLYYFIFMACFTVGLNYFGLLVTYLTLCAFCSFMSRLELLMNFPVVKMFVFVQQCGLE